MKFSSNVSLIRVAVIVLSACSAKTSDEEQVRALISAVEAAGEARDPHVVLEHGAAPSAGLVPSATGQSPNF